MADDIEAYVKIIEKEGGEYPEIFEWFYKEAPLIGVMISVRKDLMRETAPLFQKSILPHWEASEGFREKDDDLHKIILRQIVSHLAERLSLPLFGAPKHHLQEVYFRPPLREDRLHTGDLVRYEGGVHVIVTPQCNMVNVDPENFLLAKCNELSAKMDEIRTLLAGGGDKQKRGKQCLSDFASQQVPASVHYLPPCGDDGPWMIDFKVVQSVPQRMKETLLANRFASLTPQFIPNMIQRFASYIGRHGQPDLNTDELVEQLRKD